MLFSLLKRHLDLYITDTALKVSKSVCCFSTFISHGIEIYFPRLWVMGISDDIFQLLNVLGAWEIVGNHIDMQGV